MMHLTLAVQVQFSKHVKCKISEYKRDKIRRRGDCMRLKYCENEPQSEEKTKALTDDSCSTVSTVSTINSTLKVCQG